MAFELRRMEDTAIKIIEEHPDTYNAIRLMDELSRDLKAITGSSGRNSFSPDDVCVPRSVFAMAYDETGEAIGCGAFRPIDGDVAEVKRMYARTKAAGVGTEILCYLETRAKQLGYSVLRLETRLVNKRAAAFYEKRGYHRIPNYGKYADRPEAVCFEKSIIQPQNR